MNVLSHDKTANQTSRLTRSVSFKSQTLWINSSKINFIQILKTG